MQQTSVEVDHHCSIGFLCLWAPDADKETVLTHRLCLGIWVIVRWNVKTILRTGVSPVGGIKDVGPGFDGDRFGKSSSMAVADSLIRGFCLVNQK